MADRPRLLPLSQKKQLRQVYGTPFRPELRCFNGCCWPRFQYALMPLEALTPPFSHFDPFGTEFREPGRVSHPLEITKILPACAGVPGVHAPVET